jgi:hypothetical protein
MASVSGRATAAQRLTHAAMVGWRALGTGAHMNVVFALKLVAIVASGFFGVLGLVTDFRNKETGKLSAWGVLALIGVVLSSSVAFAIQYMEAIQDEKSKEAAAAQTLRIVTNTQGTLNEIRRLLTPIEEPQVSMMFKVPCENEKLATFCKDIRSHPSEDRSWKNWPFKDEKGVVRFSFSIEIFPDSSAADSYLNPENLSTYRPPLILSVHPSSERGDSQLIAFARGNDVYFKFENYKASVKADGTFTSVRDFLKAVLLVESDMDCVPTDFSLTTRNGITLGTRTGNGFAPFAAVESTNGWKFFRYDFKGGR